MRSSGRSLSLVVLPLLLFASSCDTEPVNLEAPEEVDSCDALIAVGIELVNDYVYTIGETDLGSTQGDPEALPEGIIALNARGSELDKRLTDLDCDVVAVNAAIAEATEGIVTDSRIVQVILDSVRGGVVAPILPTYGDWVLETASVAGVELLPVVDSPITLTIERNSASGFAGCNGYFYPVRLASGVWEWAEGSSTITELMCEDESGTERSEVMEVEASYVAAFELVATYAIDGEALVLTGDGVELRYVRSTGD